MAVQNVVDELVVKLTLDTEDYQKVTVRIENEADRTFRKQQERARTTDRTNKDQQRRLKDLAAGVKTFATQVTAAVGVVAGLGAAVGGALTGLLGFETGLRRQAVGTAMSNRQMQAWGATARRLGADAQAGADAIAALAKERQQFELTGTAPTMQALARMGVNVDKGRPLEEVLAQAQQIYRAAPQGQRQQYENTLAAQGVSADLILMIKSERDVREAFTQSLAQATEENRKALDQLADSLESMKATAIQVSATLLEALQPAIAIGAEKLSAFAIQVADFTKDVQNAGGGARGFQKALDDNVPSLGNLFQGFRLEADLLSEAAKVATLAANDLGTGLGTLWDRITGWLNTIRAPWGDKGLADDLKDRANSGVGWARRSIGAPAHRTFGQHAAISLSEWWEDRVATASIPKTADNPLGLPRSVEDEGAATAGNPMGLPRSVDDTPGARVVGAGRSVPRGTSGATGVRADAQALMSQLIVKHGLTAQEAAAVVANWQAESGLRADAFNPAGGGTGARGLAQWRGNRTAAFQKRYGVLPDRASIDQQVEFAMTDPYERQLLMKSLRSGNTAAEMGRGVSQYYEAHGNVREDARRGTEAQKLADSFTRGERAGTEINIQSLTVQSNEPQAFVGGLQRLSDSQNYNTVQR